VLYNSAFLAQRHCVSLLRPLVTNFTGAGLRHGQRVKAFTIARKEGCRFSSVGVPAPRLSELLHRQVLFEVFDVGGRTFGALTEAECLASVSLWGARARYRDFAGRRCAWSAAAAARPVRAAASARLCRRRNVGNGRGLRLGGDGMDSHVHSDRSTVVVGFSGRGLRLVATVFAGAWAFIVHFSWAKAFHRRDLKEVGHVQF